MDPDELRARENAGRKLALGLLIAPAAAPLLAVLFSGNDLTPPAALLFGAAGYPVAVLVGLPVHLFLRRLRLSRLRAYALAGNALGSFAGAAFCLATSFPDWPGVVLLCAGHGTVAMSLFWLIAVREARAR